MKISLNTIRGMNRRYGCADDIAPNGINELVKKIGAQLGEVDAINDIGIKYQGATIVKIVDCVPHPDSDHLHICTIDDGGNTPGVNRDENGNIVVVCGAPNVHQDMTVVWLPPGSTVPETYNKEPFVLEARELRGVVSNGMLASARELAIGDSHEGILEIHEEIQPGTLFAEQYQLSGDYLIDIENKMFTHRPDCFGFLGVSRELAGIQDMPFKRPLWYTTQPEIPGIEMDELQLEVQNDEPDLVPRFSSITMGQIEVKPSPLWLQVELSKVGLRPINNIVDYTNFFMLETGQPLHAYDYDKVAAISKGGGAKIVIRKPKAGEKLALLNGKELEPHKDAILIATDKKAIGIGGVMGGANTEVDSGTKNIILECANFDMYSIRRTAMTHGLFTDAVTRFNKGQSPLQNVAVLAKIVDEIRQFAGGKVASKLIDNHVNLPAPVQIKLSKEFINARLGLNLAAEEITRLLKNVEFDVVNIDNSLAVTAPFWRTDIEIPEDVVEEIGRLHGYDNLPLTLPRRDLTPAHPNSLLSLKAKLRDILAKAGANEVLTYSFVHGNLLDRAGQDRDQAYKLSNALSPDLQYYRQSLMPSLLDKVQPNIKTGYDEFALFEIGKVHIKTELDSDGLPIELERVALVYASDDKNIQSDNGAAYYQAQKFAQTLLEKLGIRDFKLISYDLEAVNNQLAASRSAPFALGRRSAIVATVNSQADVFIGIIGEFTADVTHKLKLPKYSAGFELETAQLLQLRQQNKISRYKPLSKFPKVEQDISLKVSVSVNYDELYELLAGQLLNQKNAYATLEPLDIYQRDDDDEHKQLTFRFTITSYDETLTSEAVNKMLDNAAKIAKSQLDAERI